jgi:acyl-CoA thioesterase
MLASGDPQFLEEMALEAIGPGRFRGRLSDRWSAPVQPQGGVTTALALRAAERTLGRDDLVVRSLFTLFAGQVPAGGVDVEVEVIRDGRSASQVRSTVRPVEGDGAGHVVLATFAAEQHGPIRYAASTPPAAPPPEQCVDRWATEGPEHPELTGPRPTFFDHFDTRFVTGHVPWDPPWDTQRDVDVVSWMRWHDTPRDAGGAVSPLALVLPCDTMPGAVFERHGKDDRPFRVPSVDLVVQIFDTDLGREGWMLRRNTTRWAGAGLAQAELEIFSADGRPLAFATQMMHVRALAPVTSPRC